MDTAVRLLENRGDREAADILREGVFHIRGAFTEMFDRGGVLHAAVPLEAYETLRARAGTTRDKNVFRTAALVLSELGCDVRCVALELDLDARPPRTESERQRCLTSAEVNTLVRAYIGVDQGYLGDFSYKTHREFYAGLGLPIMPDNIPGTTRARFEQILNEQSPDVQAKILEAILQKYPVGSSELRTEDRAQEIRAWIARLGGVSPVPVPTPRITSAVVDRALRDAESLIEANGATSGVDRVHTAFHGYLKAVCEEAGLEYATDASLTVLLSLIRDRHASVHVNGPRSDDITKVIRRMGGIADALNPLRNQASVAHPNADLLDAPEAMLVINCVRSLLHYLDARLS
jgi:hypothetical protein